MIYPVILSGGSGSRLWPMSRTALPKQFLSLVSDKTLFQETLLRLSDLDRLAAPIVVCNVEHRFMAAEQLRDIHITPTAMLLEPEGRNTAPAVAVAAFSAMAQDENATLLVLPADHLIQNVKAFHQAIMSAVKLAEDDKLVTFGITPTSAATGFGYIEQGAALNDGGNAFAVSRFVEKPDAATAQTFLDSGRFYWNSGMFVFKARTYLKELQAHQPAIYEASQRAWQNGRHDLDFCRLDGEAFRASPSDSIDYAVMERTQAAAMVTADLGWNDIGSWDALGDALPTDANGNVIRGDVFAPETRQSYIRAENRMVAAIGVDNLVIVETTDAVLVAHKNYSQSVKKIVEYLKQAERSEHLVHRRVYRPWGYYEGIDQGKNYQVKRIVVNTGEKLSLQMHNHRAEHWIVVSGNARVTVGNIQKMLSANESAYIPRGEKHRLENIGMSPLYLIEVQTGDYLGEDDIVRYDDIYQRS
jgi:mannose-1-phosphate guanylyltransferase/mannose-6-phosphate isomerase